MSDAAMHGSGHSAARSLTLAALLCAMLVAGAAHAQGPRVGVLCEPEHPARSKLLEELRTQGFEVRDLGQESGDEAGLSARVSMRGGAIQIRVIDRRGQRYERREAVIESGTTEDERNTAAMRAVEFLRAALIEPGAQPARKPEKPAESLFPWEQTPSPVARPKESPPPEAPIVPKGSTVLASLGGGPVHSTGGLGMIGAVGGAIDFRLGAVGGLRVQGWLPVMAATLSAPEGSVAYRSTLIVLTAWVMPWHHKWVRPVGELGFAAAFLSMRARPAQGYQSQDTTQATAAPVIGAGLSFLPGRVRLRAGVLTGPGLRRMHVQYAGREVGTWGGWVTSPYAAIEVGLD